MRKYLQKTTNNSYTHEDVVIQHYQNGSYDCGLFVCQNAKQTVLNLATDRIKQDNMAVIRKMMFIELMKNIVLEWEVWYLSFGIGSKNARPFQPLKKRRSNYRIHNDDRAYFFAQSFWIIIICHKNELYENFLRNIVL